MRKLTGMTISRLAPVKMRELPVLSSNTVITGNRIMSDLPRSPCNAAQSQWPYWTNIGLSRPSSARRRAARSSV